jgi:anti-sigma B factor antagonist
MSMGLTIEKEDVPKGSLIRVQGEVDLYSSPELRKVILKTIPSTDGEMAIDLSGVTYIDSSGVATLVEGLRSARENGMKFTLVAPSQAVTQVLELARLDSVFEVR